MEYFPDTNALWWYMVESSSNNKLVSDFVNDLIADHDLLVINDFVLVEMLHLTIKQKGPDGRKYVDLLLGTDLITKLPYLSDDKYFLGEMN